MSNKFLGTSQGSLNLSNGTIPFYGQSLGAQSLDPSKPVKTNSLRQLVSSKYNISDINNLQDKLDTVITSPYPGTFHVSDLETDDTFSLNNELKKIDNIISATQIPDITTVSGLVKTQEIAIDRIYNTDQSIWVEMTQNFVEVYATALKVNGNDVITTPYTGEIEASSFKMTNGTNIQYLMANGETLTASASAGNSNFYLYDNTNSSINTTPVSGEVIINSLVNTTATIVYISHSTRDFIDIQVFWKFVNTLSELYLQDQNSSTNFIQYNITATPTITVDNKIAIPVSVVSSGGTGSTSFGVGCDILVSFFTNNLEVDTRLSALETKTVNQTYVDSQTTFRGVIKIKESVGNPNIHSLNFDCNGILGPRISSTDSGIANTRPLELACTNFNLNCEGYNNIRCAAGQNINLLGNVSNTGYSTTSNHFIKTGGLSYETLMADGSTTVVSVIGSDIGLGYELVPRGARDTWVETATGGGGSMLKYFDSLNLLYCFGNTIGLPYSQNGGVSFTNSTGLGSIVFGTPSYNTILGKFTIVGGHLTTLVVYNSVDGIDWTALPSPPTTFLTNNSKESIYFNGLHIITVNNVGFNVATSADDGLNWILHALSNTVYSFSIGVDDVGVPILVTAGSALSYTYDGITWFSGTGATVNGRAITYSNVRKEFIAHAYTSGIFYRSLDGKAWSSLSGTTPYTSLNTLMWVGDDKFGIPINQYYFTYFNATFNTITLGYSPNCDSGTFRSIKLNGFNSTNTLSYGIVYMMSYDRFGCTNNSNPYFKYANKSSNTVINGDQYLLGSLTCSGGFNPSGLANIDIMLRDTPFIGIQYINNSGDTALISNSLWTALGSTGSVGSTYALTNNFTRQLCSALWTTVGLADGAACGFASTITTGARVSRGFNFGLSAVLGISDSAYNVNNCQNFFGLWNLSTQIPLNQATQLSVQRNMVCFGSDTDDTNICIYTAGASSTVKQVDLGVSFPANRPVGSLSTDWFKFSIYWDTTKFYYKAVNTTTNVTVSGTFTALVADIPATTIILFPQCVRIMGTPQTNGQARLQVQRFGVYY